MNGGVAMPSVRSTKSEEAFSGSCEWSPSQRDDMKSWLCPARSEELHKVT